MSPFDASPAMETVVSALPDLSGKSVAIIAMGPSHWEYVGSAVYKGHRHDIADEIWAINSMAGVIQCDRVFFMDSPPKAISEQGPHWRWLNEPGPPIFTCQVYPEFPRTLAYPLEEVIERVKHAYLNTSVAYAMAYAIACEAERILLFGTDFSKEGDPKSEPGRGCLEFWIGICCAKGIKITLAGTTQLMDMNVPAERKLYGYFENDLDVRVTESGGRLIVVRKEN